MSLLAHTKRILTVMFIVSFFSLGLQGNANAGIVSSEELITAQQFQLDRLQLKTWMAREDVREQLVDLGVDVDSAIARVDSMTNLEVQQLSANMNDMPAGSGFIETAVLAFLVLIILEVTGVTDILPNI
ncbi:hypothetical protein MNBD_GAMMA21-1000 [hydrothermal vent metagenome]|uniref:PA2779 family protein n=1 Tax=hydrothermal vent metagenome TaxID=652676 RepID=A0A3B1AUD0_9ZZZZ